MALVVTGYPPLDRPHRDLAVCLRDLATTIRARDIEATRGQACLLVEKFAEHFAEEEEMMRAAGWRYLAVHAETHAHLLFQVRRFERRLVARGLSHDLSAWGLNRLPELVRYHCIVSDFGFGKFALQALPRDRARRPGTW
jgi:hemerythrin-like metal-binding protein